MNVHQPTILPNEPHPPVHPPVPATLTASLPQVDNIPADLREVAQWVCWRYVADPNGRKPRKPRKVPVDAKTGWAASVSDPTTWASFDVAVAAARRTPGLGVGFVLTAADPFVGIDLDGCIDPATRAFTDPAAREAILRLASYTEASPSNTGVHIILRGKLPPGGRRKGAVEMYDSARYLTFTGNRVPRFPKVEERQAELDAFHAEVFGTASVADPAIEAQALRVPDETLLAKAKAASNGDKFSTLWEGRWQEAGYPSQSEADMALCSMLAFWTGGQAVWLDALFRKSGLFRPKWDERHYADGATYGARLVQQAVAGCRDHYKWPSDGVSSGENPANDALQTEIAALSRLSLVDYERARKEAGERLGLRVGMLDKLVAAEREGDDDAALAGRSLALPSPEPWADPVDGSELLAEIVAHFRRFAALPAGAVEALALWAVHAHCIDASPISPRLALTSPEKRCGKTTVLRILAGLVPKPLPTSNITPAAVFRTIEVARPTLLVDEADSFAKDNDELRGILNSGHARDGNVVRLVGDDHTPRQFATFCPTVIASIGHLSGTVEDRAVIVPMRRRLPNEKVERFRLDRPQGSTLARKATRWAADNLARLSDADPAIPEQLGDRAADNWRPLLAIADAAGGDWPTRARHAALTLSGEASGDASIRVQLLGDIREAFRGCGKDRLTTDELLGLLVSMRDRPWGDWTHGRAISARRLAALLSDFQVSPSTIRVGATTAKGYTLDQFKDAFARYLLS